MAKISLNKLNLDKNIEVTKLKIGDIEIEVLNYLPVSQKLELLDIAIQESIVGSICDPILQDSLFHMYLIMMYTNISLTPTQKENILDTYDLLEKNGVISEIVNAIPKNEYLELLEGLDSKTEKVEKELNSIVTVVKDALDRIPQMMENVQSQLAALDINSENIQDILAIARDNGAI